MTTSQATILDTDILSAIMRKHSRALERSQTYLDIHGQFTISCVTLYEIRRGLKAKKAEVQVAVFDKFCETCRIIWLTDEIVNRAADILYQRGELIGHADILIAASAIVNGCVIVTNNEIHFKRIEGLGIENWLK
jgi:tRNA(fMet)-specific endonuclease VapC